jgi:hypothetical protein
MKDSTRNISQVNNIADTFASHLPKFSAVMTDSHGIGGLPAIRLTDDFYPLRFPSHPTAGNSILYSAAEGRPEHFQASQPGPKRLPLHLFESGKPVGMKIVTDKSPLSFLKSLILQQPPTTMKIKS